MRGGLAAAALALALGLATSASAELRRVETVGSVPVPLPPGGSAPREAAVREALAEAVRSIARDLLRAAPSPEASAVVRALGPLPGDYVLRQRIVEDRGERAALLASDPSVTREYVVVVEAEVDADRLRQRLAAAGLSPSPSPAPAAAPVLGVPAAGAPGSAPGRGSASGSQAAPAPAEALAAPPGQLLLVLEAPTGQVYTALRDGLRADAEVQSALPVEFSASRVVLGVATALGPGELLARVRTALPDLRIEEVRPPEGRVLVLRAEQAPPPAPEAPAPEDGSAGPGAAASGAPE